MYVSRVRKLLQIGFASLGLCLWLADTLDPRALAIPYLHPATTKAQSAPKGTTIKGTVTFQGKVDVPRHRIPPNNGFCSDKPMDQGIRIDSPTQGIQDVIVFLDHIQNQKPIDIERSISLTNKNCAFQSRVATLSTGQHVQVINEDPILHNVHILNGQKTILNVGLPPMLPPFHKEIRTSGVLQVQCALHDFMTGFIGVFNHPYHGQTNRRGEFQIENAPPGEYELRIWHEVFGTRQKTIIIPESESLVEVSFEFSAPLTEPRKPVILAQ